MGHEKDNWFLGGSRLLGTGGDTGLCPYESCAGIDGWLASIQHRSDELRRNVCAVLFSQHRRRNTVVAGCTVDTLLRPGVSVRYSASDPVDMVTGPCASNGLASIYAQTGVMQDKGSGFQSRCPFVF